MAGQIDPTVVRDVVMVVPGIMGSTLIDAKGRDVWSLRKRTLVTAIATLGGSANKLALPSGIGDEPAPDGVRPGELMPALHAIPGVWTPVDGYAGLLAFLRGSRFHLVEATPDQPWVSAPNLITFPYDWRLSIRYNGRCLAAVARQALTAWRAQPGMDDAKLVLICHSMGGLVARWFLEHEGGAEDTRHLVTIGTPHRGSVKPLDFLVNGIEKGIGPLQFRLSELARSLPSLYQMLPSYACLSTGNTRSALFADEAPQLPDLDAAMLADAHRFHEELAVPVPAYAFHKVVGTRQPTLTTATLDHGRLTVAECIDGRFQGGDGTVPRLAAEPLAGLGTEVHEVAGTHGLLHGTQSALDLIEGILSRREIIYQGGDADAFGVRMDDLWTPLERPALMVTDLEDRRIQVSVLDGAGEPLREPVEVNPDGSASLDPLAPGAYLVELASPVPGGPGPIRRPIVVFDPATPLPPEPPEPLGRPDEALADPRAQR